MKFLALLEAFILISLAASIFVGCPQMEEEKMARKGETPAPVITHAFAVDKGYYGVTWKIYIEAEDPDADMERIAVAVSQVGYGQYATDWIILEPQYREHFVGYLQWNTFSLKAAYLPEWTRITVRVSVFDQSGNESNEVVFPFTFESGVGKEDEIQLPVPFDTGNLPQLGYIMIDILNPSGF